MHVPAAGFGSCGLPDVAGEADPGDLRGSTTLGVPGEMLIKFSPVLPRIEG